MIQVVLEHCLVFVKTCIFSLNSLTRVAYVYHTIFRRAIRIVNQPTRSVKCQVLVLHYARHSHRVNCME